MPSWVSRVGCAVVVASASAAAQAEVKPIKGVVTDSLGHGVPWVDVGISGGYRSVTDDSGHFTISFPLKGAKLSLRRIGYDPAIVEFSSIPDSPLRLTMRVHPQKIDPIMTLESATIVAQLLQHRGFYNRMQQYTRGAFTAHFLSPEDIERRHPPRASYLLDGLPGVRIIQQSQGSGPPVRIPANSGGCPMTLYVDGVRVWPRLASVSRQTGRIVGAQGTKFDDTMDSYVTPNVIAGMEIYPRSTPAEFPNVPTTCGSAVVWTK